MAPAKNVLITGASSGIGEALALECARRGAENLFICGRDETRLADVARRCGPCAKPKILDVSDEAATREWIRECDDAAPIELAFANAGVGTGKECEENVRRTFATNLGGALNVALPLVDIYRARGAGRRQLVLTSSIAGYAPLATCPSYAGSKAAVKNWGLSLRANLRGEGIKVNVVCPGFVRSRITEKNTCPMPFFMEADKAARTILSRVDRDVGLIAFPWQMRFATWLLSICPWRLAETISRMLPAKNAESRYK